MTDQSLVDRSVFQLKQEQTSEDQGARPVSKYTIDLKRIINFLISREDKTDEIKDKTGLKLMKMGI